MLLSDIEKFIRLLPVRTIFDKLTDMLSIAKITCVVCFLLMSVPLSASAHDVTIDDRYIAIRDKLKNGTKVIYKPRPVSSYVLVRERDGGKVLEYAELEYSEKTGPRKTEVPSIDVMERYPVEMGEIYARLKKNWEIAKKNIDSAQKTTAGESRVYEEAIAKSAVVTVIFEKGLGTGFLVSTDGYLITNAHVIQGDTAKVRFLDGKEFAATLLKIDSIRDVALLKIEGDNFPFLPMGNSDLSLEKEKAVAIGSPKGKEGTVTQGNVNNKVRYGLKGLDWVQMNVPIAPGNSGGPLINTRMEVIGVNTWVVIRISQGKAEMTGENYAIPINAVKEFIEY